MQGDLGSDARENENDLAPFRRDPAERSRRDRRATVEYEVDAVSYRHDLALHETLPLADVDIGGEWRS